MEMHWWPNLGLHSFLLYLVITAKAWGYNTIETEINDRNVVHLCVIEYVLCVLYLSPS